MNYKNHLDLNTDGPTGRLFHINVACFYHNEKQGGAQADWEEITIWSFAKSKKPKPVDDWQKNHLM